MTTEVHAGQIWIDNDPRMKGREVLVQYVDDERVKYINVSGKRIGASSQFNRFIKAFTRKK